MRAPYKTVLLFIFLVGAAELTARAQESRFAPLPIEDALRSSIFPPWVPISLSPNGQWVAFTLQEARKLRTAEETRYSRLTRTGVPYVYTGSSVRIANTQTGESRNLTGGKGTNWGPVWSPDGRYLAFSSDRSGESHVWLWEESTGTLRQLGDTIANPHSLEGARWTRDSKHIIIRVLPEGMTVEDLLDIVHGPTEQRASQSKTMLPSVTVIESRSTSASRRQPQERNTTESTAAYQGNLGDLAVIDIANGEVQRIARRLPLLRYRVSPDGAYVALISFSGEAGGNSQEILYDLSLVSLTTKESRVVASNIRGVAGLIATNWSPDSKSLAYTTGGLQGKSNVFLVSVRGGEPRNLTAGSHPDSIMSLSLFWGPDGQSLYSIAHNALWKVTVASGDWVKVAEIPQRSLLALVAARGGGRLWSPDGGRSAVVMTRNEETLQNGFYSVDLTSGKSVKLSEETKSYAYSGFGYGLDVSADGQTMVYLSEDAQHSQDVWTTGADLRNPRRVTSTNPQFDRYLLGASRLVKWRSDDGQELRGALLLPAGYEEGKRYPLIVWVYGGALLSMELNKWGGALAVFNMQLLATRGYAVLFPDAPQRVGTPMQDLAKTVLPGVEKVVELGIADPERLGVMGQSYGGYSTYALIAQSTRFKAAVVSAGSTSVINAYARPLTSTAGWVEEGQGKMGASLWERRDRHIENSPLFYLDRVQVPVLILHGASDAVVPRMEAQLAFYSLRRLGKEVVYASYAGEDHSPLFWGYANQVDYVNRVINWFDEYLKKSMDTKSAGSPDSRH